MLYSRSKSPVGSIPLEHNSLAASGRQSSDVQALAELYEQYFDRVVRYFFARTGNRDTSEDLAAEVFVRAVESFDSFQERGAPVGAWLFRIAHNLVIDYYRRSGRRQAVPIDDAIQIPGHSDPASEAEHSVAIDSVNKAMAQLNEAQRQVIALRFMGELSAGEAGSVMGRTPGAIRELQRTALKALRSTLGAGLIGEDGGMQDPKADL